MCSRESPNLFRCVQSRLHRPSLPCEFDHDDTPGGPNQQDTSHGEVQTLAREQSYQRTGAAQHDFTTTLAAQDLAPAIGDREGDDNYQSSNFPSSPLPWSLSPSGSTAFPWHNPSIGPSPTDLETNSDTFDPSYLLRQPLDYSPISALGPASTSAGMSPSIDPASDSRSSAPSPSSLPSLATILVPQTPVKEQKQTTALGFHDPVPTTEPIVDRQQQTRASLLHSLRASTTLLDSLRTRLEIHRADELRYRALTDQAREDRVAAEHERDRARKEKAALAWCVFVVVVVVVAYVLWVARWNPEEMEYIRRRREEVLGIRD